MSEERFAIGIDFGTSTSEIAVFRNGQPFPIPDPSSPTDSPIVPSLVALNRRDELVVGEEARSYVDLPGRGIREVKRELGSGAKVTLGEKEYRPEEIAALVLLRLKAIAEQALGHFIGDVVLSVPANFPDAARRATLSAGQIAGLNIVRLINEPTAAALAYGIQNLNAEEQLVVFDFGGGTLDITVLEMMGGVLDVKRSFGDPKLGGKDFDETLTNLIINRFQQEHPGIEMTDRHLGTVKGPAETAKVALSNEESHVVLIPNFATEDGIPVDLEVTISRQDFDEAIAPLLERARHCMQGAVNSSEVRQQAIDRVLLVGGTTYIPAVRRVVAEFFGREPEVAIHPDLAVVMGAATQASIIGEPGSEPDADALIIVDKAPYGLGIKVVRPFGDHLALAYSPLILPNTTIPYATTETYRLLSRKQEVVELSLYQDQSGRALLPSEATYTGISGWITNIPPSETEEPHPLEVEFAYDANGLVSLKAQIPATNQDVEIHYHPTDMAMSEEEKLESVQQIQQLWAGREDREGSEEILQQAVEMMDDLDDQQKEVLSEGVEELRSAMGSGDEIEIHTSRQRLRDLMFDLEYL